MMLNHMPAGRPEPQWTQYDPGSDFEDCEYKVDEMEILGVKQRYILIRGTIVSNRSLIMDMPADVTISSPLDNIGAAIICDESSGKLRFWATSVTTYNSNKNIEFNSLFGSGARVLVFVRVS